MDPLQFRAFAGNFSQTMTFESLIQDRFSAVEPLM